MGKKGKGRTYARIRLDSGQHTRIMLVMLLFGLVAFVAMTPLVTIQLLGLKGKLMRHRAIPSKSAVLPVCNDCVIYYD